MKQGRGRFDLTVLDGVAYAVGGCDGSRELSSVEAYKKGADKWVPRAPLPLARSNIGEWLWWLSPNNITLQYAQVHIYTVYSLKYIVFDV